jgi:DNA ligase D-like protein (predicted 3'-phosphoesterase)
MFVKTMSLLNEYQRKRDFSKTGEPKGKIKKSGERPLFVIQKHDAKTLHYDFRLEVGGVLKSWAIPKGPSTDPGKKRLALPTEDHPLDYAVFEGIIPEGNYGAGTVLIWDKGTYKNLMEEKDEPLSMEESIEKGHVEVWLEGQKIRGGYSLVQIEGGSNPKWLLIKMSDEGADARRNPVKTETKSVLSGRTIIEITKENKDAF